jgi:hypothetical protein
VLAHEGVETKQPGPLHLPIARGAGSNTDLLQAQQEIALSNTIAYDTS